MKSFRRSLLKSKVWIAPIVVCLAALGFVSFSSNLHLAKDSKVRIAFNAKSSVTAFDPARIQMDVEAIVLDNLYSPLVRMGSDGTIEPFFAEHYWWNGNTLHFKIRENFRTVDGWAVTAKDAEFTLKRILISDSNAHGNLAIFLCTNTKPVDIESECPGIQSTETELRLTVANVKYKPFLLKLLASMDFGIIPKLACNLNSPRYEIRDRRLS